MNYIIQIFIKYFFLYLASIISFDKILKIKQFKSVHRIILLLNGCVCAFSIAYLQSNIKPFSALILVLLTFYPLHKCFKLDSKISFCATMISYCVSYFSYIVAGFMVTLVYYFLGKNTTNYVSITSNISVGVVQLVLVLSIFQIKRFKHGLQFLQEADFNNACLYVGLSILSIMTLWNFNLQQSILRPIIFFILILLCIVLFYEWRLHINHTYCQKIYSRNLDILNQEISALNIQIEQLQKDNYQLSSIIHTDNKIIPAMHYSVSSLINDVINFISNNEKLIEQAQDLINNLNSVAAERTGIIKDYENKTKPLPTINISSIDSILSYMHAKAISCNIIFDVSFSHNVKTFLQNTIKDGDTCILLCDLIENAIIATSSNTNNKRVFVEICLIENILYLQVADNGSPFPENVMHNWGIRPITTHKSTGGSGIGLMSIHKICNQYNASFQIEVFPQNSLYTKRISIVFDGKCAFIPPYPDKP